MASVTHQVLLGSGSPTAAVAYVSTATLAPLGSNPRTFTGMSFGAAATDRYIVAGITVQGTSASNVTAVTIGGIAATIVVQRFGTQSSSALVIALVPTGTSGTVAVTLSGGGDRMAVVLWRLSGLQSPTATDSAFAVNATTLTTSTLDILAGGVALGITCSAADMPGGVGTEWSWIGLNEDFEGAAEPGGPAGPYSGASKSFPTAQTNLTVSATVVTDTRNAYVIASWR